MNPKFVPIWQDNRPRVIWRSTFPCSGPAAPAGGGPDSDGPRGAPGRRRRMKMIQDEMSTFDIVCLLVGASATVLRLGGYRIFLPNLREMHTAL